MNEMTIKEGARIVYRILDKSLEEKAEPLTQERIDKAVGLLQGQKLPLAGRMKECIDQRIGRTHTKHRQGMLLIWVAWGERLPMKLGQMLCWRG